MCSYDEICTQICHLSGIRFTAIINKNGRKISGGFNPRITPLEKDDQKMEMLFMEIALDLSMRKEFDNSLGIINAIVSYRDRVNIITIPYRDNLILISAEPELEPSKIISIASDTIKSSKVMEVITQ